MMRTERQLTSARARRGAAIGLALAAVVAMGACAGDDGDGDGGRDRGIELPDGPDDVVLRLGDGPMPTLLIAGDGSVYQLASESLSRRPSDSARNPSAPAGDISLRHGFAAIAPAPAAAAPMTVRHLTDEGLRRVFERADELGLLDTPPDYADVDVTDSGSTYLELRDTEGTYEHVAYALGYDDDEIDADRQAFRDMVDDLGDIERLAGRRNVSDPEPYEPEIYVVSLEESFTVDGRAWPDDVALNEGCVALPPEQFPGDIAGTYTFAGDSGADRRVWVVPDLPGDDC